MSATPTPPSVNNLMEQIITTQILSNAMNSRDNISIKHLLIMILLEPIKRMADKFIREISEINLYDKIKILVALIYNRLLRLFPRRRVMEIEYSDVDISQVDIGYTYNITVTLAQTFWLNLINGEKYKGLVKSARYMEKMEQVDNNTVNIIENWSDITITLDDITLYFNSGFTAKWAIRRGGVKELMEFAGNNIICEYKPVENPDNIDKVILDPFILEKINNITQGTSQSIMSGFMTLFNKCDVYFFTGMLNNSCNACKYVVLIIMIAFDIFREHNTNSNYGGVIATKYYQKYNIQKLNKSNMICGVQQNSSTGGLYMVMMKLISIHTKPITTINSVQYKCIDDICKYIMPLRKEINDNRWRKYIAYLFTISDCTYTIPDESNSSNITDIGGCKITSRTIADSNAIYQRLSAFIGEVSGEPKRDKKDKVKVYAISITQKINKSREKNPAYDDYNRKLESIKLLGGELTGDILYNIPAEYVEVETVTKMVECREINEVYKSIDTMYLSQRDKSALTAIISNYRDNVAVLERFGLPNRLGVMLYGAPGCGKSSTIVTIASEMQRDIYYLDINKVETNDDIALMFDHVNTKAANSGIICIEDIDAMNPIFLKRDDISISSTPIAALIANSKEMPLTLEFMLNILDGTLTKSGSIVIMTTNHIEKIDPAIYRPGRMNLQIELKAADHYQIAEIYKNFFHREINKEILMQIPEYRYTPAEFIFHFANYIMVADTITDSELVQKFLH